MEYYDEEQPSGGGEGLNLGDDSDVEYMDMEDGTLITYERG